MAGACKAHRHTLIEVRGHKVVARGVVGQVVVACMAAVQEVVGRVVAPHMVVALVASFAVLEQTEVGIVVDKLAQMMGWVQTLARAAPRG